jgi:glutamine cyclotransferase
MMTPTSWRKVVHLAGNTWRRLGVPRVSPRIVRRFPHDPEAFTQGLLFEDGCLFESTGLVGKSSLRQCDPLTGAVLRHIPVDGDYAEGITVFGTMLYQLSWQSGIIRLYRWPTLDPAGLIHCPGEGWGLTASPESLVISDGTSVLRFRDEKFLLVRELRVNSNGVTVDRLNDLAWAQGRLYANVWRESYILEIDPGDGRVLRVVDCSDLYPGEELGEDAVLNGIAFNAANGLFFVTGKRWPWMYEVEIPSTP